MARVKKYKLIRVGKKNVNRSQYSAKLFRLQALIDIPEHGVKAGDLGGYVYSRFNLSHIGSCWVGEEAQIVGRRVSISEDAYIGGQAVVASTGDFLVVIQGKARVTENSTVAADMGKWGANYNQSKEGEFAKIIRGNAQISGHAFINGVNMITDNAKVYGNAYLYFANRIGYNAEIFGDAKIGKRATIGTETRIFGNSSIGENCRVDLTSISGNAIIPDASFVSVGVIQNKDGRVALDGMTASQNDQFLALEMADSKAFKPTGLPREESDEIMDTYNEVLEGIATYETDIVKIIKHPVMTDRRDPHTLAMVIALKNAKRLHRTPESDAFKAAVQKLEEAFLVAESNALRLSVTGLSDKGQRKAERASDLLDIAANEVSSEQEKKVAFKQAFKQLEGIIMVPEIAVETFRIKVGLKELES
jgi:carbonic anhydrase/acetyltransferase-like protein (isoleucine patch superfamily)